MQRGCQRAGRGQRGAEGLPESAGGGTKQVEWNRVAVSAGQGKVVSVGATRVWGGGEMKQAARWVQGSALG